MGLSLTSLQYRLLFLRVRHSSHTASISGFSISSSGEQMASMGSFTDTEQEPLLMRLSLLPLPKRLLRGLLPSTLVMGAGGFIVDTTAGPRPGIGSGGAKPADMGKDIGLLIAPNGLPIGAIRFLFPPSPPIVLSPSSISPSTNKGIYIEIHKFAINVHS